jgi:hypothetical protein
MEGYRSLSSWVGAITINVHGLIMDGLAVIVVFFGEGL